MKENCAAHSISEFRQLKIWRLRIDWECIEVEIKLSEEIDPYNFRN